MKVGRSDSLDKRLAYWRSHDVQIGYKIDCDQVESHLLEYALLRGNSRPSWQQIKAFTRRSPMFPLNRLGSPQGSSEWIISDPVRAKSQADFLCPLVKTVSSQVTMETLSEGKRIIRHYVPRADGIVDTVGPYDGPILL